MKVAYIGNFEPQYSTENDVRRAFEHLGHEVVQLQENKLSVDLVSYAATTSDLLLITSSWEVLPLETMLDIFYACAKAGIPTATIHLDTFWPVKRQGRAWWRNPMFHTAYIFTADGDWQREWKLLGKNHTWLPPAVRYDAVYSGTYRDEYACDVAFVGSNGFGYHEDVWTYRQQLINALQVICKKNSLSFRNPGGESGKPNMGKVDRGDDLNDFYASAKVIVGDSLCIKKEAAHYWSDRVPETTGRGGFLIMPQIDALHEVYGTALPMYKWGDWVNLEENIIYFLEHDKQREQSVKTTQHITTKDHTYVNRVETMLLKMGVVK